MFNVPEGVNLTLEPATRTLIITTSDSNGKKRNRTFGKVAQVTPEQVYKFREAIVSLLDTDVELAPDAYLVERDWLAEG